MPGTDPRDNDDRTRHFHDGAGWYDNDDCALCDFDNHRASTVRRLRDDRAIEHLDFDTPTDLVYDTAADDVAEYLHDQWNAAIDRSYNGWSDAEQRAQERWDAYIAAAFERAATVEPGVHWQQSDTLACPGPVEPARRCRARVRRPRT